ncbi:MAG TPA: ribosome-associated translation inhibitor RaiA [Candidatus Saccharimonadales bacterium]|nr:ribosome-associated translation inhibitor RaiA [Candidatus Saccharimonadales bacterium]
MIERLTITGVKVELDAATKKYVTKKIARLDRYLPKHARRSVSADVKLKQVNRDHGNKYEAEVIFYVPDKILTAKDSTVNLLAAVDIVEAKLVSQLRKYKETLTPSRRRGVLSRLKGGFARAAVD